MNERIGPTSLIAEASKDAAVAAVRRIGFWGSVLLPAGYLPVLYALSGSEMFAVLGVLLAANLACLHCGRQYAL
jgi:hypothetical protein